MATRKPKASFEQAPIPEFGHMIHNEEADDSDHELDFTAAVPVALRNDPLLAHLRPYKTIRIAVSGDVLLTRLETDIIDTEAFQRLRGIRQLGSAAHVYPTAVHTRFDHSLGTLATADTMIRAIKDNRHSSEEERTISPEQEAITRLYALLHDITHVPSGHLIEDELLLFKRHDENAERIEYFLGARSEIGALIIQQLGLALYSRLMRVFLCEGDYSQLGDDAFIYDIVSNTVCADLLDYVARDSYFCNLGFWFEFRFLHFLYLHKSPDGTKRVLIRLWKGHKATPRRDTLSDLTRLLEARYLIAERVYYHPAKIVSGTMLGRALQEAGLAAILKEDDLYRFTDDTLLDFLLRKGPPLASSLARQIASRRLYKPLRKLTESDFLAAQAQNYRSDPLTASLDKVGEPRARRDFEDHLAAEVGAEPGDVLIYAPPTKMNSKIAKMQVLWKGKVRSFGEIDDPVIAPRLKEIVRAHELLWGIHIFVKRDLSEQQRSLIKAACEIEFLADSDGQLGSRQEYYEKLVELQVINLGLKIPSQSAEYYRLRVQAASELAAIPHDPQPWKERIADVISKVFGRFQTDKG